MKIGIITYHNGNNHGAVLQAYALCKYLNQNNHNAEVIRFTPQRANRISLIEIIKTKLLKILKPTKHNKYDEFVEKYVPVTKIFDKRFDLSYLSEKYDAFITGSDQVFNVHAIDKKGYFFLSFVTKGKRVSYAASFGESSISREAGEMIKEYIDQFDALSVREKTGVEIIEKISDKKAYWTIDPTFLLNSKTWNEIIEEPVIEKPYIFAYYNSKDNCNDVIKKIAQKYNLEVVVISPTMNNISSEYIKDFECSPNRFLGYIKNATIVCADSFHGTALSVIFRKPFITYVSSLDGKSEADARKVDLLNRLGLSERLFCDDCILNQLDLINIDYKESESRINSWIDESKEFLNWALM